jgi:hypothetical protein
MTDARRNILSVTTLLLTPYRSLVELGTNYAGAQSERYLACGVLNFDMDTAGRRAVDLMVTDVQNNFNGKLWEQNGPDVVNRVLQTLCGTKHVSTFSLNECLTLTHTQTHTHAHTNTHTHIYIRSELVYAVGILIVPTSVGK